MMSNEKAITVLNSLIQINNDRIEGYVTASKETDEGDLKALFSQLQQTSEHCNNELISEVQNLGGTPPESTKTTGKFFRVWMDVKAALSGKDRKVILDSCEYGEDVAKQTYEDVLNDESENLSFEQKVMIKAQHILLKADHDTVKNMRDTLITH